MIGRNVDTEDGRKHPRVARHRQQAPETSLNIHGLRGLSSIWAAARIARAVRPVCGPRQTARPRADESPVTHSMPQPMSASKSVPSLGFLTVIENAELGLLGGYLLLNA